MKRSGFTMIELIFVIVILGILAAVAIPKLTATRTDAQASKISANLATVVTEAGSVWTSTGVWPNNWTDITNVPLQTTAGGATAATTLTEGTAVFLSAGTAGTAADGCFSLNTTTDGNLTVTALSAGTNPACSAAQSAAAASNVAGAADTAKVHSFGGTGVSY